MTNLDFINSKICNNDDLKNKLLRYKFEGKKIIFTNGCFDILHRGHVEYLSKAKDLGDILIIGLNTDESVKKLKGESRPINNQYSRALLLSSLLFVDAVVYFNEDNPLKLIKDVEPDILVKGGDYKAEDIIGYDFVKSIGGDVVTINLIDGYSTTNIIKKADI